MVNIKQTPFRTHSNGSIYIYVNKQMREKEHYVYEIALSIDHIVKV